MSKASGNVMLRLVGNFGFFSIQYNFRVVNIINTTYDSHLQNGGFSPFWFDLKAESNFHCLTMLGMGSSLEFFQQGSAWINSLNGLYSQLQMKQITITFD